MSLSSKIIFDLMALTFTGCQGPVYVYVYTVESDDFIGLFGNKKYCILTAIIKALEGVMA